LALAVDRTEPAVETCGSLESQALSKMTPAAAANARSLLPEASPMAVLVSHPCDEGQTEPPPKQAVDGRAASIALQHARPDDLCASARVILIRPRKGARSKSLRNKDHPHADP
jgi:hypothetical protein